MKTLTTLFVSAALMMGAGLAQADVSPAKTVELSTSGAILAFDKLDQTALAQHPKATIVDTELDESYGRYIYQVDLRDDKGQKWEVEMDAATGEILKNRQDD